MRLILFSCLSLSNTLLAILCLLLNTIQQTVSTFSGSSLISNLREAKDTLGCSVGPSHVFLDPDDLHQIHNHSLLFCRKDEMFKKLKKKKFLEVSTRGSFLCINSSQSTGNFSFQDKKSIHYFEVIQVQIESTCITYNTHCD